MVSVEDAHKVIAELRRSNGGVSAQVREQLEVHVPEALLSLQNVRRKLANSIRM